MSPYFKLFQILTNSMISKKLLENIWSVKGMRILQCTERYVQSIKWIYMPSIN